MDKFAVDVDVNGDGDDDGDDAGPAEYKVTLVGDSMCGKTALIRRFMEDKYLEVYTPTGFQRYSGTCDMGDRLIDFTLWDTSGLATYDHIRPLAYQNTRVFVLCFNIGQPESLDNVVKKWHPEVRQHAPEVPVILCGCQSDTRTDVEVATALPRQRILPVTFDHATMVSKLVNATCYLETSSRSSSKSVQDAFEVILFLAAGKPLNLRYQQSVMRRKRRSFMSKVRFKCRVHSVRNKAKSWSCSVM